MATTVDKRPTSVQTLAARVRMKADRRLKRESPRIIKNIARGDRQRPTSA
jgi:hypothetical protein